MANFNEILIKARFLDENHEPKGREYTFIYKVNREHKAIVERGSNILMAFPAYMQTIPDGKKVVVTNIFVNPEEVAAFADRLKEVVPFAEDDE